MNKTGFLTRRRRVVARPLLSKVRLLDVFECKQHLCLVFELLSINLYELLKQNQFRGLPLSAIRVFLRQVRDSQPHPPPNPPQKMR